MRTANFNMRIANFNMRKTLYYYSKNWCTCTTLIEKHCRIVCNGTFLILKLKLSRISPPCKINWASFFFVTTEKGVAGWVVMWKFLYYYYTFLLYNFRHTKKWRKKRAGSQVMGGLFGDSNLYMCRWLKTINKQVTNIFPDKRQRRQ